MEIISSREFRQHQRKYFDKVDQGMEVIIKRSNNKSYRMVPVREDDKLITREEMRKRIQEARQEKANGELITVNPDQLWESI